MRRVAIILGLACQMGLLAEMPAVAKTVKIAYIDALSGPTADVGELALQHFQFAIQRYNAANQGHGFTFELLAFDNKFSPQESVVAAQKAIDAGARIITQGNGSSVAAALSDYVGKFNARNPGKETIYLNYAAVDPVLTNERCNYWHFRWDAHSDIKLAALTNYIGGNPAIRRVYLINQDYSLGQAVQKSARAMLQATRPDLQIVGDELHPIARITDFAPYIAKIKASGADSVITANWGSDLALLFKAAGDAGLKIDWYTFYAGGVGSPTAAKQAGVEPGRLYYVVEGHANAGSEQTKELEVAFRKFSGGRSWIYPRVGNLVDMLAMAIRKTGGDDPVKLAAILADMTFNTPYGGEAFMRTADHQLFQDLLVARLVPLSGEVTLDEERTGWGWQTAARIKAPATVLPTTCKMQAPG